ncbi:ABC transporter transmembrane region domain-containing protein [Besnoitia besnoiti]|uniref:ABC transporter transmembrane region domain-containing protein n=1 Tax=Besnoitia besnoiti TaxID=94643 RepID=A0A2A9M1T3_BESBE|nr:ABC transporter transmembrane region domain-containing protein [Besnoitia besnoiti]PFH32458.1 ABC transporter transmembrane region domain-containing protein [Besnoitia besnoiti]
MAPGREDGGEPRQENPSDSSPDAGNRHASRASPTMGDHGSCGETGGAGRGGRKPFYGRGKGKARPGSFESTGFFGKLLFTWVNPVISRCMRNSVRPEDLPPLGESDDVRYWSAYMARSLTDEENFAAQGKRQPSVIRALWRVFRWMLLWIFFVYIIRDGFGFLNTYFLKRLLQQDGVDAAGLQRTLVIGSLISVVQLVQMFVETAIDFYTCRVYMRVEICLLTALFKKVIQPDAVAPPAVILRESLREEEEDLEAEAAGTRAGTLAGLGERTAAAGGGGERKKMTNKQDKEASRGFQGNVFNLMFVDIPSLASLIFTFVDVAMLPVRIGLAAVMLYMQVGVAAEVPGLIAVLVITVVTTGLEIINASMKTKYMIFRDIRLDKSHEALSCMRTLRLLGWEDIAEFNIKRFRDLEMQQRTRRMYISAASTWLSSSAAMAMSVATFIAYALPFINAPRFRLRPELAIPVIHLLDNFIGPITDFPYAVNSVIEAYISLARIQNCFFPPTPRARPLPPPFANDATRLESGSPRNSGRRTGDKIKLSAGGDDEDSPLLWAEAEGLLRKGGRDRLLISPGVRAAAADMLEALESDPEVEVIFSSASFAWLPHTTSPFSPPPPFPAPAQVFDFSQQTCGTPEARGGAESPAALSRLPQVFLLPPPDASSVGAPTLCDLSFRLRRGELLLLTGPPGCGKSSVLHALLQQRELQLVQGSMFIKAALGVSLRDAKAGAAEPSAGTACATAYSKSLTTDDTPPIGYIAQEPWLQIGTIKENIVFNQELDEELYRRVVQACELHLDFESWPGGDGRFIDEGGADLSGGQRMRITMARAIYVSLAYRARARAQAASVAAQLARRKGELAAELRLLLRAGENPEGGSEAQAPAREGAAGGAGCSEARELSATAEEVSHLLCFDETFNSLDPYVAGRIFANLFGPQGLLGDAAVIVGASEQSLSGLVEQMNGGGETDAAAGDAHVRMSICCLLDGQIVWRGAIHDFRDRMRESAPPGVGAAAAPGTGKNASNEDAGDATSQEETIEGMLRGLELEPSSFSTPSPEGEAAEGKKEVDDMLKSLMVNEQEASGQVKLVSYTWYLRRVGVLVTIAFFLLYAAAVGTDFASDLWIAQWTGRTPASRPPYAAKEKPTEQTMEGMGSVRSEEKKITEAEKQAAGALYGDERMMGDGGKPPSERHGIGANLSNAFYLWFYVGLASANVLFELLMKLAGAKGSLNAARLMHNRLLNVICTAPLWFYDQNPIGRILNRLSTDIAIVDAGIFKRMGLVLGAFLNCVLGLGVLAVTTFWALPVLPILLLGVYYLVFRYYRATCREVQRASLISFSPLCSSFSECLSGRDTIFALRRKRVVCEKNLDQVENSQRTKMLHWGSSSWASIRLQLLTFPLAVLNAIVPRAVAYVQLPALAPVAGGSSSSSAHAGYLGLALSYSLSVASSLRRLLIHYAHLEKEMCSVERVHEYISCTGKMTPDTVAVWDSGLQPSSTHTDSLSSSSSTPGTSTPPAAGRSRQTSGRSSFAQSSASDSAFPFLPLQRKGLQLVEVDIRYRRPGFQYVRQLRESLEARLEAARARDGKAADSADDEADATLPFLQGHPATEKEMGRQVREIQNAVEDLKRGDEAIFLSPSLHRLSARVGATHHVGVVGRTGSGKSTLLQALTGLVPCYRGAILLDGIRIDCLPKQVLKQVVGVLPQNPVVFKGMTVRDVMDPRRQHTDDELWAALDEVGISAVIQFLPGGKQLDTVVAPDEAVQLELESADEKGARSKARMISPEGPVLRRRSLIRSSVSLGGGAERDGLSRRGSSFASERSEEPASSHPLSDVQLRYLALARLVLRAASYRLILVDEPPAETLGQLHAEAEETRSRSIRDGEGDGPQRQSSAASARAAPAMRQYSSHTGFTPIPQLIRRVFAHCTVFIVAHHVASLRTCDRVWLMWKGWKIGECSPDEIKTDKQLAEVMVRQVNQWRLQRRRDCGATDDLGAGP